MKLAFCLPKYFPYGGLQSNFLRIATALSQQNHQITVFTMAWQGPKPAEFDLRILPVRAWQNHRKNAVFIRKALPSLQREFDGVIGFMKMPALDIYYAADPCYKARNQHRSLAYRLSARARHFVAFEQAVFNPASNTEILMLSATEIDQYQRCYHTQRQRFHLLPPGINRDRMAPTDRLQQRAQFRRKLALSDDDRLVLMIGSGFKTKGLDRTLLALAALPPALQLKTRLIVLGEGKPQPFIRLATRLGVHQQLQFCGGRDDVPSFLFAADLLIHPAYSENTGNVLLEAIIAGLPVLTTANCGFADHVLKARAGKVLPVPFQQHKLNHSLAAMLVTDEHQSWSQNGIRYGQTADLYNRISVASEMIVRLLKQR